MSPSIQEHKESGYFLEFVSREGQVYGFPYAQLIHYRLEPNPALETAPGALPDQLTIWFSALNVVITGWHLEAIRILLRSGKNFSVTAIDPRYRNLQPKECFVAKIKITVDNVTAGEGP